MIKFFARWPSGREVTFRSLSWAEFQKYEQALQYRSPAGVYLDVYRAVVLTGPRERDVTAGIVEYVGRTLLDHNPFNGNYADVKRAIDLKRDELQRDYLVAASAVIASLFQVSVEDIRTWDSEKFFEYVAMAEFVSGRKLEPGDPAAKTKTSKPARPSSKAPLTERQQVTLDRVRERDQGPPVVPSGEEPAPKLRRPITPAQQIVVDRVRNRSQK
ncbi:hypothetical protein D4R30_00935 [archaeon]|nr:MAG: hypothetical protein D4R30_00935 [archaeon]